MPKDSVNNDAEQDAAAIRAEFARYNGFYTRPDARQIIYQLFKGRCAATGRQLTLAEANVGHIIPQSEADYFERMFPGLDVHNLINLHLLDSSWNRSVSNHFPRTPLFLHNAFSYNIGLIRRRVHKVMKSKEVTLDPEQVIISLTHHFSVDYSAVFPRAVQNDGYFILPQDEMIEIWHDTIEKIEEEWGKFSIPNKPQYPFKNHVTVHVDGGYIKGLASACSRKIGSDNLESDWVDSQFDALNNSKAHRVKTSYDDGSYILTPGEAVNTDPVCKFSAVPAGCEEVIRALRVLAEGQGAITDLGFIGGQAMLHIDQSKAMYQFSNRMIDDANNHVKKVSPLEAVFFLEDDDPRTLRDRRFLTGIRLAPRTDRGCLVNKKEYNRLIRRLKKAISADLRALNIEL